MQTFKKAERLSSKKQIEKLFGQNNIIKAYPIIALWVDEDSQGPFPVKVLISIPKKKIRTAVQRNLIKRRIREAYRKHKQEFYSTLQSNDKSVLLGLVYTAQQGTSYKEIESKIIMILNRLQKEYEKTVG